MQVEEEPLSRMVLALGLTIQVKFCQILLGQMRKIFLHEKKNTINKNLKERNISWFISNI